ncbi:MAG: S8 family serine peptidase [Candidatus Auribacterota bacterium]|nr:S8 family serine peptidase [Candidatus Auribacterota bacterium]
MRRLNLCALLWISGCLGTLGLWHENLHATTRVALLDTGCALENVKGVSFTSNSPFDDPSGHGTMMAKIIREVNPRSELIIVKVANHSYDFSSHTVARGLQWCLENNIDVINLSFTTDESDEVRLVIGRLIQRGVTIIAAVGNCSSKTGFVVKSDNMVYRASDLRETGFPANIDEVIAAGAVNMWGGRAEYARNTGEIATDGKWFFEKGTSISSARLSGYASLLKEQYPHLTNKEIRVLLHYLARNKKESQYLSKEMVQNGLRTNLLACLDGECRIAMAK